MSYTLQEVLIVPCSSRGLVYTCMSVDAIFLNTSYRLTMSRLLYGSHFAKGYAHPVSFVASSYH